MAALGTKWEQNKQENPLNNRRIKQQKEHKTVGILQFVSHEALDEITRGVKEGLKQSGYTEGDNLTIEFQNGQADQSKLATMSQQLLNKGADVLVG